MNIHQTQPDILQLDRSRSAPARMRSRARIRAAWMVRAAAIVLVLAFAGGSAVPAHQARLRQYAAPVSGWGFNLLEWEIRALADKTGAALTQPSKGVQGSVAAEQVIEYLERANRMGRLEHEIEGILSDSNIQSDVDAATLQRELDSIPR